MLSLRVAFILAIVGVSIVAGTNYTWDSGTLTPGSNYAGQPVCTAFQNWRTSLTGVDCKYITISGSRDPTGFTCNDPNVASQLCSNIVSGQTFTAACNGKQWAVGGCGGAYELLVWDDGVSRTRAGGIMTGTSAICQCSDSANVVAIRPCLGSADWGGMTSPVAGTASNCPGTWTGAVQTLRVTASDTLISSTTGVVTTGVVTTGVSTTGSTPVEVCAVTLGSTTVDFPGFFEITLTTENPSRAGQTFSDLQSVYSLSADVSFGGNTYGNVPLSVTETSSGVYTIGIPTFGNGAHTVQLSYACSTVAGPSTNVIQLTAGCGDNCDVDCAGVPHGTSVVDSCGVCNGDNSCRCNNYLNIENKLWDYILLPIALDDMIERLESTHATLSWLKDNLPEFEDVPSTLGPSEVSTLAQINRMFLMDCGLAELCHKSHEILTELQDANDEEPCEDH